MKNNNQIISDKTGSVMFWGICLILILPMIILPPSFEPSSWSRSILFRSAITMLLAFLLFKYFYKKNTSLSINKLSKRAYLPLFFLSAFFITLILSAAFSEDVRFSVFNSPSRAGGVLNLLFFFIFTIFIALFIDEKIWKKLFKMLLGAGVLISSLAILQYLNIFKNLFISYERGNPPSFLGNSTFLAIYMLFLCLLSLSFFTQEKNIRKKLLYGGLFLLFAFTILISAARAVYMGLAIGLFYFFFFYPVRKLPSQFSNGVCPNLKILKIIASLILIFAIIIVVLFNFFPQIAEKNNLLEMASRRLNVKNAAKDLMTTRFAVWNIAIQAIKEKPIFGYGPENFYIVFEKYYDPAILAIKNTWWDRTHNEFLEIAASSGIMSLFFYCLFWISLLWQLQKFKNHQRKQAVVSENQSITAHGLLVMFLGYLVALFFGFDDFSTYLISFFFIGYSFYLMSGQTERKIICPPKTNIIRNKFICIPLLLLLICFIWFWNIKPLYVGEKVVYASNLANIKKCEKALQIMENVWDKSFMLKAYSGLRYASILKNCAPLAPDKEVEYSQKAVNALEIASKIQPKFSRTWLFMASFNNVLGARQENPESKKKLLSSAIAELEEALKLSPKRQEIIIEMEKSYLVSGDYESMIKRAKDCVKIDQSYGWCYWYWGIAEIFLGKQEEGKKHIEEMQKKSPEAPPFVQLGIAYISQKNYKDAAEAYSLAVWHNDRKNISWHATLAFLYKQIGEYEKAGKSAITVFDLQPGNKEAIEFIKELLGLDPNDPTLHSSLAYIYTRIGEPEKARQEYLITKSIYLQLITKYPKKPEYHFSLAGVSKELGDYEMAYEQAVIADKIDKENFHKKATDLIKSLLEKYWEKYLLSGGKE